MTVFMRMVNLYLTREENDEFSPRMMKFFGSFVASFGEEVNEEDGGSHLIIQRVFKETLSVSQVAPLSNRLDYSCINYL